MNDEQFSRPDAGVGVMPPSSPAADGSPPLPNAPAGAFSPRDLESRQQSEAERKAEVAAIQKRIAEEKAQDARDAADAKAGIHALKSALGDDYAPAMRVLRSQFGELPETVRERLYSAKDANGRLVLNDPVQLRRALQEIIDSKATGKNLHEELAEMRRIMREDRRRWNRDEALQMRYRQLLRG